MDTNCELPADFRYKRIKHVRQAIPDIANSAYCGRPKLSQKGKLLTRTIWLAHNQIKSIYYLDIFFGRSIDNPMNLVSVDFSYNLLKKMDKTLLLFVNIKLLYLHCNLIADPKEILMLDKLPCLCVLTIHGNPVYKNQEHKKMLIKKIPQIPFVFFIVLTTGILYLLETQRWLN